MKLKLYQQKHLSLENFDDTKNDGIIINTPRSLEACRRQGIEPHELIRKTVKEIKKELGPEGKTLGKQILEMGWQHFETRR